MRCPNCSRDTLRLSPKRRFHECGCGYCVLAPGVLEQIHEEEAVAASRNHQISAMETFCAMVQQGLIGSTK